MAIVIHTRKEKYQYAYEHTRIGDKVVTRYMYPVNARGDRTEPYYKKVAQHIANYEIIDNIEDLEGHEGIYFRVESDTGANIKIKKMHSIIGSDQIDTKCSSCGTKMDLDDLEAGCSKCGSEASQNNRYAKMINDFNLSLNQEGDYELPGLLAFEYHSAAYEYANNVPGGIIVAYKGREIYYGMQEPDTGWDEFLITPQKRFRDDIKK